MGIYARTITIKRPNPLAGVGAQGYSSLQSTNETVRFTGIPASIQRQRRIGHSDSGVPSATDSKGGYGIYVPDYALVLGDVTERDVVIDDLGKRYQVMNAYWNILGYKLVCVLLEN